MTIYHLQPPQYFGKPIQYFWQVYASASVHILPFNRIVLCQIEYNNENIFILIISLGATGLEIKML